VYLLSVAGLIACKDANLFEAFSCSWISSSTFYKLLEIERTHKQKVRMARKMRTPKETRKRVPIFQTDAWDRRKEGIPIWVRRQGKRSIS